MATETAVHTAKRTGSGLLLAPDLLRRRAEAQPDRRPFTVDGGPSVTYADWERRSNAVAHGLLGRGLRTGDRVALYFGGVDWVDYAVAYLGVLKAGGTATHLNDDLDPAELTRRLRHAEPVGLIHGRTLAPPDPPGAWRLPVAAVETGDHTPVDVALAPDDIADILYTSGTTGPPKPMLNPHGNLSFNQGPGSVSEEVFDSAAPVLSPTALGTVYSAGAVGIFALATTAPILLCGTGDVERMAYLIAAHRAGSAMLTPWAAMRMVLTRVGDRHDLSSVTTVGVASANLPARYARALLAAMPNARMMTAYGGGLEAVPASIRTFYDPAKPTCVGRPGPGTDLRLVDGDGREVCARQIGLSEVGEVQLRHGAPRRRYLTGDGDVDTDGWIRTGDLARVSPDGEVFFFDRGVDAIRTGGRLVSSLEVESAIYDHPGVEQVAVIGVAGEIVAVVVGDAPDLDTFLADDLRPHAIHFVADLPRGPGGKVLKNHLRDRYTR
jgi:fatty-acyl-CoA synthase